MEALKDKSLGGEALSRPRDQALTRAKGSALEGSESALEGSEAGSKLKALGSAADSSIKRGVWSSEEGQRLVFWFTYFLELNTNYHLLSTVVLLIILCRISVVISKVKVKVIF